MLQKKIFFAKKLSVAEKKAFTRTMPDMLYSCGATLQEFINPNAENNNKQTSILEKCFVRANNNCGKPVEALCYSVEYPDCCCHCGSKRYIQYIKKLIDHIEFLFSENCVVCKRL